MRHPDTPAPAAAARTMRCAMNLRQRHTAQELAQWQQQRAAQGKPASPVLVYAQHFAQLWPRK